MISLFITLNFHICTILASERLQINGSALCLESDGTMIEDSETLQLLDQKDIIMLLASDEKWKSVMADSDGTASVNSSLLTDLEVDVSSPLTDDTILQVSSPIPPRENPQTSIINREIISIEPRTINDSIWESLDLHFDGLSQHTKEKLNRGLKDKDCVTELIRAVVSAMRTICIYFKASVIKIIANRIIQKYPQLTDCHEDGTVLGKGYITIFAKIQDRNNFLNRRENNPSSSQSFTIPIKKRKIIANRSAGCSNWQPTIVEKGKQEEVKSKLKNFNSTIDEGEQIALLAEAYSAIRLFLNNPDPPAIQEIMSEWPVVFEKKAIYWHYHHLMGHSVENLTTMLRSKSTEIIKLAEKRSIISDEPDIMIKLLSLIGNFFKEKIEHFYNAFEVSRK